MQVDLKVLKAMPPWEWPPEARDFISGIIIDSSSSSSYLMDALELVGDPTIIDSKIAEALLRIVCNESLSSEIRGQAVISLGPVLELKDSDDSDDGEELLSDMVFLNLKKTLKKLFHDSSIPEDVRRKVLEASVRSPEDWHKGVLKSAFQKGERWQLTAVFGMRWISGCDAEILTALHSSNPDVLYEAVCASAANQLDRAWKRVIELASDEETEKYLLMASIEAAFEIRPDEAGPILVDLSNHEDPDVGLVVNECMVLVEGSEDGRYEYDEFDDLEPMH